MKTYIKNLFLLPVLIAGLGLIPVGRVNAASPGTVVAWGWNAYGQTNVPAGLSGATAIAAGALHTVAVKSDGTVVAWGAGTTYHRSFPGVWPINRSWRLDRGDSHCSG